MRLRFGRKEAIEVRSVGCVRKQRSLNFMNRVIVVGGSGFVGSAFAKAAVDSFAVVSTTRDGRGNTLALDLLHPEKFRYDEIQSGDSILFSAAISSPDICGKDPQLARQINVNGPAHFLRIAAKRGARIVFLSSDTVLGPSANPAYEDAVINPVGEYAAMKSEMEGILRVEGIAKTVRLSLVISLQDKFSAYVLKNVRQREPITLLHPIYRNAVHLLDVIQLFKRLFKDWGAFPIGSVHACGSRCLSRIGIAEQLFECVGYSGRFGVERPADDFYRQRPEQIMMGSRYFSQILGREPLSMAQGYRAELNASLSKDQNE
jgi:dTDP-4-dehydrorhamnose reductase